jgi:hypothetical protein
VTDAAAVPLRVRVLMAHATVQLLADAHGLDVLHVKGEAIDPTLATPDRRGTDADVLVRPSHVGALLAVLQEHQWTMMNTFRTGSPFEHAATLAHPQWGYADVHRLFPGITAPPEGAFERLWTGSVRRDLAGLPCAVPSIPAQVFILVLNAARSGWGRRDLEAAWWHAPPEVVAEVHALVRDLGAEVAFAAATGDLERFRGRRGYDLWRITTQGGGRVEEWVARIRAAPDARAAALLAVRAFGINRDHLTIRLGRKPTRTEVLAEGFSRFYRAVREVMPARPTGRSR